MKTAIGYPQIYFTVYEKKPSQSSPSSPFFKVIGSYTDIRDAIQAIVTASRSMGSCSSRRAVCSMGKVCLEVLSQTSMTTAMVWMNRIRRR
jgi:hypothetical protein